MNTGLKCVSIIVALTATACTHASTIPEIEITPSNVPAEYTNLYETLSQWLTSFDEINQGHAAKAPDTQPPIFAAHLLAADANRGEVLLDSATMLSVEFTLKRMEQMGVTGITLVIGYPMFLPSFENSERYLEFYKKVAQAVRDRNMKLLVEHNVLFLNSEFTPLTHDFTGLTVDEFTTGQRQMAETILKELKPDYLTIMHEPHTFAVLARLDAFYSTDTTVNYVERMIDGLDRRGTKIGAGAGNWDDLAYTERLSKTAIDYVSLHVYWVDPASVERAYSVADIARDANKELIVNEAWLFKSDGQDNAAQSNLEGWEVGFRRDVFGFWEPLDERFIRNLVCFSENTGASYVAPYWTNYMFAYVDYNDETRRQSYKELVTELAAANVATAILRDRLTETGRQYRSEIAEPSCPR
jgi:hypothetical protein